MRREYRERFPRHRGLAIPKCITARAVSFEVDGGENAPGIPGACGTRNLRIWWEAHIEYPAALHQVLCLFNHVKKHGHFGSFLWFQA